MQVIHREEVVYSAHTCMLACKEDAQVVPTHVHTICTHMHGCMGTTCTHTHAWACTQHAHMHTHAHTCTSTGTCTHTGMHTHMGTHGHGHVHTHTHTHMHTHTCTHTQIQTGLSCLMLCFPVYKKNVTDSPTKTSLVPRPLFPATTWPGYEAK